MPVFPLSEALFAKALQLMPGGVNSPVRAWQAVGGTPFLVARGEGSRLYDVDGNSFLDYVVLLGAADPGACLSRGGKAPFRRPVPGASASGPPRRARWNWRNCYARPCRPSRWCAW